MSNASLGVQPRERRGEVVERGQVTQQQSQFEKRYDHERARTCILMNY